MAYAKQQHNQLIPTQRRKDGMWLIRPRASAQSSYRMSTGTPSVSGSSDPDDPQEFWGDPVPLNNGGPNMLITSVYVDIMPSAFDMQSVFTSPAEPPGSADTAHSTACSFAIVLYHTLDGVDEKIKLFTDEFKTSAGAGSTYARWVSYGWNQSYTGFNMANDADSRFYALTSSYQISASATQVPEDLLPVPNKVGLWLSTNGCSVNFTAKVALMWEVV